MPISNLRNSEPYERASFLSSKVGVLRKTNHSVKSLERELLVNIFAHWNFPVFLVSGETQLILFANPKALKETGYPARELIDSAFSSLFMPEEAAAISMLLIDTLKENACTEPVRLLKRKDQNKTRVEIATSLTEFEGKPAVVCTLRDLTTHFQAELDDVMCNIRQAIFTVGRDGRVNSGYSRFVLEIFGSNDPTGQDIGKFLYELDDPLDKGKLISDSLAHAFEQPGNWPMIKELLPADLTFRGHRLQIEWCPILDQGQITKVMAVCTDVTEKLELEEEISKREAEHTERLEFVSQLINLPPEIMAQFVMDSKHMLEEIRGLLQRAESVMDDEALNGLMRTLHTLKGTARQFRLDSIQKFGHELESRVVAAIKGPALDKTQQKVFLTQLNAQFAPLEKGLSDIYSFYAKTVHAGPAADIGNMEVIRVPISKIKMLMEKIPYDGRPMSSQAVRQAIEWLFQEPIKFLFDRLDEVARSLSRELGQMIRITRVGDELAVDHRISGPLYDAFLHVVRNCVDHGADTLEERRVSGKPDAMCVTFSASVQQGENLIIEIIDDGKGIDVEKVKARVLQMALADEKKLQTFSKEQIIHFIFEPGFSTHQETTLLSGRGVGLDVVREVIEKNFLGEVAIFSEAGVGTRLRAQIPLRALSRPAITHLCLLSEDSLKATLENSLNIRLQQLELENDLADNSTLIVDLGGIEQCLKTFHAPPEKVICFDLLEPKELVDFIADTGVRHFIDRAGPQSLHYMRNTLLKMSGASIWGLERYLWPATFIHHQILEKYSSKESCLLSIMEFATKLKGFSGLPEIMATISDELIMNAMFDAPRDSQGREKYNHFSRTSGLCLEPHEAAKVRFGADPNFIGISIEDPFGALTFETVVRNLKRCFSSKDTKIDFNPGQGGAGLGLFKMFENSHRLIINVSPGKKTEIICLIALSRSFERYQKTRKSFSFFSQASKDMEY